MSEFADDMRDRLNDKYAGVKLDVPVTLPRVEELEMCAKEVLWQLDGDHEIGIQPGNFHSKLIEAMCYADPMNLAKFILAFPAMGTIVMTYKTQEDGLAAIRSIALGPDQRG